MADGKTVSTTGVPRRTTEQMDRRYWMDEEEQDAVYHVFLKKVRYGQEGGCCSASSVTNGVSYLEWQTIKVRLLKAGSLEKILESLINADHELDSGHVNIFLDTYREFTSPEVVIEYITRTLGENYGLPLERPLKQLALTLVENYPEDFSRLEADPSIIQLFEHAEKYGDLELKSRLKLLMIYLCTKLSSPHSEVLEWIQDSKQDSVGPQTSPCASPEVAADYPCAEDLLNYSDRLIAEQLTLVDAVLLNRLLPHECLAQERAAKTSGRILDTVQATISHFNAVCARVESSLLEDLSMTSSLRLRLLIKWIDIAQFLLIMKNFSSLNAVISALQAEPVFRLEKLWASLPVEKLMRFKDLAGIFSGDRANTRNELHPAATMASVKQNCVTVTRTTATLNSPSKKNGHRRSYSDNPGVIHGIIPYLGKFLTDLVMLDTALPDQVTTKNGQKLINFDKRRKEFEILAQIRLFQSAASSYQIEPHDHFRFWFYKTLRVLGSEECFNNSFVIEAPNTVQRSASEISDSSDGRKRSALMTGLSTLKRIVSHENLLSAPFIVARKNSISSSQSLDYRRATLVTMGPKSPYLSDTFCILKISLDDNYGTSVFYGGVNLYKSILVNDCEKTPAVIRNALGKHGKEEDIPENYDLVQVLSAGGEFIIPADATVFYAINSGESDLKFTLRRKPSTSLPKFLPSSLPKSSSNRRKNSADALKKWAARAITRC